jgi:aminoglycoside phosphotransferase family enzyme/predicted kinase
MIKGASVRPFEVRETHAGAVFLVGEHAYKLKKPVDLGFLDFRTRESRLAACHREVMLNRRLAPDVYLGVADVSDVDGAPCDHLVVMRRMPEVRRLASLVAAGVPVQDEIVRLARVIASFHAGAHRSLEIAREGTRDAIQARWQASLDQVESISAGVLDAELVAEIRWRVNDFLAGRGPLFADRVAAGRIVDGHGDLLADDIFCLDDGPRILDCLDFDDRLRYLDGLDDIAFLAMDLERLGAPELAALLLDRYAEFSGDPAPARLREHYLAYRAFVRVKVACLRHTQGDPAAAEQARAYAAITREHLRRGEVRLILVGGLPGTGKTTLAGLLADELGAVLIGSDRLRKELAGRNPADPAAASYLDGIYTPEHTERVYREMVHRAENLLARGESVVLDASWTLAAHRAAARAVAERTRSGCGELRCDAPAALAAGRLRTRVGSCSDATSAIATAMAAELDPWPEASVVSTVAPPEAVLVSALRVVGPLVRAGAGTDALQPDERSRVR